MKITANVKLPDFRGHIAAKRCRPNRPAMSQMPSHPPGFRDYKNRCPALFGRRQPFPQAPKRQLNSKGCGHKEVDFSRFKFLEVAHGDHGSFGEFLPRQPFANPLTADVHPEKFDAIPFFFGNSHTILHRGSMGKLNDTYIAKILSGFACQAVEFAGQQKKSSTGRTFYERKRTIDHIESEQPV